MVRTTGCVRVRDGIWRVQLGWVECLSYNEDVDKVVVPKRAENDVFHILHTIPVIMQHFPGAILTADVVLLCLRHSFR